MSNGKLLHKIFVGVYNAPAITDPTSDIWIFEDGAAVLMENNDNLIQE